ncbi:1-acyl-sn-glycerol-3-phosphate acyltransferase [Guyparkeria hydrothermalis]|uniref:lysophospholipid acyltransferase family protein n=1 Tax=Guyparkeria hydrothermalis TaxID=923 RepID=UPI00201FF17C|nr:lysophospholipid acyltransferase family protein [Guyparkeria hydrothermalis]MCL7743802.1 1-acyl-sn-glycerol-3-phosphate acyltransferase [Guyparkeria hydrothermalis]
MSSDRRRPGWHRLLGILALLLGFGGLGLLLIVWLPLALLLLLAPGKRRPAMTRRVIHHAMRAYRGWLSLIGGCRFDTKALDELKHAQPGVIIANHPALLDALVVLAHAPNVVCVMRAGLLRNPLLALPARLAGYLPNDSPVEMMLGGRAAIRAGCHVLLFPEGSRTRGTDKGGVDPFHPAAFMLAERARAPIHAYLFRYDAPLLGKDEPLWRPPLSPVRLRVTRFADTPAPGSEPRAQARAWQTAYRHALEAA